MNVLSIILSLTLALAPTSSYSQEPSCAKELGKKKSQTLVNWCLEVTPATHPPCNLENSCNLIVGEIQRGCRLLINDKNRPYYCLLTYNIKTP